MTVLVTTDRTLTGRLFPDLGGSKKNLRPDPSRPQSAGENGERALRALRAALLGEGLMPAEKAGDCGIFNLFKPFGELTDCER